MRALLAFFVACAWAEQDVPLEPYMARWCAMQFPDQLHAIDADDVREEHVPVEPHFGLWCFDQFAHEFVALQKEESEAALYVEHEDLEPFLQQWGDQALWSKTDIEPYVGGWCKAQWHGAFGGLDPVTKYEFYVEENGRDLSLEPYVAQWCF